MVGISGHPEKMLKKSFHRKNDSGELDVFEAAKYFSGANETHTNSSTTLQQKDRQNSKPSGRFSLDMPMRKAIQNMESENTQTKEKNHKQPSSPAGRLANFLNSLFNQASLKKKKPKSSSKSVKDDEESPGWRRKRRSSISNFQLQSSDFQPKDSGFRTPPVYSQTPKNSYKDFRSYSDHKEISPFSFKRYNNLNPYATSIKGKEFKGRIEERSVETEWGDRYSSEEKEFRKFSEADDCCDSDSSSDLFDLPNCDLDLYSSSGLPVYESTNIESLNRNPPISRGPR